MEDFAVKAAAVFGAMFGFMFGAIKAYLMVTGWVRDHKKVLMPLILDIEKACQDGEIVKAERKSILLNAVAVLESEGRVKLKYRLWIIPKFWSIPIDLHWLSSLLADIIAQKLPDSKIAPDSNAIIGEAIKRFKEEPAK
jgi:hypothetical protein